jgi:hypothetical protein
MDEMENSAFANMKHGSAKRLKAASAEMWVLLSTLTLNTKSISKHHEAQVSY